MQRTAPILFMILTAVTTVMAGPTEDALRIGEEAGLPELKSASLVTHVYRHNDRVVGVLGILGSKRMEYSRMMGLVDYIGRLVESSLQEWDEEDKS